MALISDEQLNLIRSKVSIVDVVSKYVPLTPKGKNYFGVCPFHEDHAPSMSVSVDKQIYKCFSCGASGNVFTFVQNFENVSWPEAVSMVAQNAGINITIAPTVVREKVNKVLYDIMDITNKLYHNNLKSIEGVLAKKYLLNRGISDEIINKFEIGLTSGGSLKELLGKKGFKNEDLVELGLINNYEYNIFQNRIMFPLWDSEGNVVGFSGRIYDDSDNAKYVNSKENKLFHKSSLLYNYHHAVIPSKRVHELIIVEGFMDAIRIDSIGLLNVVALMGTAMTSEHVELIKKLRVKVLLCMDNDNAGLQATINNGKLLESNGIEVSVIKMSGTKDADEYIIKNGSESFKTLVKEPVNFYNFRLNYLKDSYDMNNPKELAKYINEVIDLTKDIKDPILRELTINNLAKDYDINLELLKSRVVVEPKVVPKKVVKKVIKTSNLDDIGRRIIYYLMNDVKYIELFKTKLGFLDNPELRSIVNEILYYVDTYGDINMADFMTYMSNQGKGDIISEIMGMLIESDLSFYNMNQYLDTYLKRSFKEQIRNLREKMTSELDVNKKMEMAKRIAELKKGSVN